MSPVGQLITRHGVEHHQYTPMTRSCFLSRAGLDYIRAGLMTLEACARDVRRWFVENDLLVNADKSEVMMIGSTSRCSVNSQHGRRC